MHSYRALLIDHIYLARHGMALRRGQGAVLYGRSVRDHGSATFSSDIACVVSRSATQLAPVIMREIGSDVAKSLLAD